MILFVIPFIFLVVGVVWWILSHMARDVNDGAIGLTVVSGLILFILFMIFIQTRAESDRVPENYRRVSGYLKLVDQQKDEVVSEHARFLFQKDIESVNAKVDQAGAWNDSIFDIFLNDEAAQLKPIK